MGEVAFEYPFLVIQGLARNVTLVCDFFRDDKSIIDFQSYNLMYKSRDDRIAIWSKKFQCVHLRENERMGVKFEGISVKSALKCYTDYETRDVLSTVECFNDLD